MTSTSASLGAAAATTSSKSSTAVTEALGNHDLLSSIFSNILPDEDLGAARRSLLNVALVCSTFQEPALDCLWRHLDSLIPLIRLLPSVEVIDDVYCGQNIVGLGSSFPLYAKRVRSFRMVSDTTTVGAIDRSILDVLLHQLDGEPLLPCLTSLKLSGRTPFPWDALPIFLSSPTLQSVDIDGPTLETGFFQRMGLSTLSSHAKALKRLVLTHETAEVDAMLWEQVLSFERLEELSLCLPESTTLPSSFVSQLGKKLPRLSNLILDVHLPHHDQTPVDKDPHTWVDPLDHRQMDYQNLTGLHLVNRSRTDICRCISNPSMFQYLTSFSASIYAYMPVSSSVAIANQLTKCPSLRRVELQERGSVIVWGEEVIPYLQLLTLEELIVNVSWIGSEEHDSPEICLQKLFPELFAFFSRQAESKLEPLRTLVLSPRWAYGDPVGLTSLTEVARQAKGLRRLHFPLDTSLTKTTEDLVDGLDLGSEPSPLEYLEIADARLCEEVFTATEQESIARYLDTCFPNLVSVTTSDLLYCPYEDDWKRIEEARKRLQASRLSPKNGLVSICSID